ncbi:MAG TPA: GNAT family N-acetyltransferase [Gaiellaceae bacterium]|nr:GNAT family N-acetyltransferase [Gaiellaceae bacterium]
MLTLWQAEWCPYSSAVREVLTELGLDFVAKQVEPYPEDRGELRRVAGTDTIPVLQLDDGEIVVGTRAIYRHLETVEPWQHAADHRLRFVEHADAREADAMGQLVERFRLDRAGEPVDASPENAVVVHVPERNRYEIRLGDRVIGHAAYHVRGDRIAFTHTEIDAACEGRGFGTRLVGDALEHARGRGLSIVPLCSFVAAYVRRHSEAA